MTTAYAPTLSLTVPRAASAFADEARLPAPDPEQRVSLPIGAQDRRRLDLHAVLTAAGIAPLPGDLEAIEALCRLDDCINSAVHRWITGSVVTD